MTAPVRSLRCRAAQRALVAAVVATIALVPTPADAGEDVDPTPPPKIGVVTLDPTSGPPGTVLAITGQCGGAPSIGPWAHAVAFFYSVVDGVETGIAGNGYSPIQPSPPFSFTMEREVIQPEGLLKVRVMCSTAYTDGDPANPQLQKLLAPAWFTIFTPTDSPDESAERDPAPFTAAISELAGGAPWVSAWLQVLIEQLTATTSATGPAPDYTPAPSSPRVTAPPPSTGTGATTTTTTDPCRVPPRPRTCP